MAGNRHTVILSIPGDYDYEKVARIVEFAGAREIRCCANDWTHCKCSIVARCDYHGADIPFWHNEADISPIEETGKSALVDFLFGKED